MGFLTGDDKEEKVAALLNNPLAQTFARFCLAGLRKEATKIILDEARRRKAAKESA